MFFFMFQMPLQQTDLTGKNKCANWENEALQDNNL